MTKIVECVPNFSEGQDQKTIEAISKAIENAQGCTLLDVDPGYSTNRTVYTFVGNPEAVIEGALAGARVAREMIDMREHKGEHPRFGAMDVCPFIPVAGVTMQECVEISKAFAKRAADELGVPFYLYEEAASEEYRSKLPDIRDGEYEGLEKRLQDPRWKPDFGPTPMAALTADTDPPPGAELRDATSSMNALVDIEARGSSGFSAVIYSIIRSSGLKRVTEFRPRRSMARRSFWSSW